MKTVIRYSALVLIALTMTMSSTFAAKNLEKLDLAPKLPESFGEGGLKKLEFEPGYEPAERLQTARPIYPREQQRRNQAGIVEMAFMVDKEGKVFEPIVLDSTHPGFEPAALDAVRQYVYTPASLDGTPVESANSIRIVFAMNGAKDAAGRLFFKLYKRTDKQLKERRPDQQVIRRDLDRMADADHLSSYTLAYLYLLEHTYAKRFQAKEEQLYALRKVLMFENSVAEKNQFLDQDTTQSIRMNILQLLIQLGYYGEARSNYYWLQKELPEAAKPFEPAMAEVYQRLGEGGVISRPIKIHDRGHEYLYLTKRSFEIHDVEGKIEKLNFYCSDRFGTMAFSSGSNYQVPESWGRCDLQIVGDAKTTAVLYQL